MNNDCCLYCRHYVDNVFGANAILRRCHNKESERFNKWTVTEYACKGFERMKINQFERPDDSFADYEHYFDDEFTDRFEPLDDYDLYGEEPYDDEFYGYE